MFRSGKLRGLKLSRRKKEAKDNNTKSKAFFGHSVVLFLKEVLAELSQVKIPSSRDLWKYVVIVLGFLVFIIALVLFMDFVFGFISSWVFGNGTQLFPAPAVAPSAVPSTTASAGVPSSIVATPGAGR